MSSERKSKQTPARCIKCAHVDPQSSARGVQRAFRQSLFSVTFQYATLRNLAPLSFFVFQCLWEPIPKLPPFFLTDVMLQNLQIRSSTEGRPKSGCCSSLYSSPSQSKWSSITELTAPNMETAGGTIDVHKDFMWVMIISHFLPTLTSPGGLLMNLNFKITKNIMSKLTLAKRSLCYCEAYPNGMPGLWSQSSRTLPWKCRKLNAFPVLLRRWSSALWQIPPSSTAASNGNHKLPGQTATKERKSFRRRWITQLVALKLSMLANWHEMCKRRPNDSFEKVA